MNSDRFMGMAREMKRASKSGAVPIWARMAREALKPGSAKRVINIKRIGQLTAKGDTAFFPGKVLGVGSIPHPVTIFAFSISRAAASKIVGAGGTVLLSHEDAIRDNPAGKGVVLLG